MSKGGLRTLTEFFNGILQSIYGIVHNYGWTIILFTLVIKVILLPFDFKSRKSMRRMEKLNPKLQALQKKYANDKEKLQKKQAELYQKEKINPLGSCLPLLLTFPIMIIMFNAMRSVANGELVRSLVSIQEAVGTLTDPAQVQAALPSITSLVEPFAWIKNIWMADSPFTSILPSSSQAIAALGNTISNIVNAEELEALKLFLDGEVYQSIVLPHYGAVPMAGGKVNLIITTLTLYKIPNGFFILPILIFVSSVLTTALNPQPQQAGQDQQAAATNSALMKWGMPLFMTFICATTNSAFSLYYVASNFISIIQQIAFRKYFEAQDARELAQTKEVNEL